MIVHPPSLYLGYVGMTIPFGIAVAALVRGELGAHLQLHLRRWLLLPWTFLSLGITLGGWWAYEVLGWGGYWAWDPVENASLLPWLTATAALHAAMLPARRAGLSAWTLTLVLVSFLLTLLGTFMTRSGVFNSVHSFSQSEIGPVFLGFIAVAGAACVALLAARVDRLSGEGAARAALSRESAFLVNNLLFVSLTFTVLVGTTFPLLAEAIRGTKLSVGAPYFDRMAVPIGVAILYLMAIGPALPWGEGTSAQAWWTLRAPLGGGVAAAALAAVLGVPVSWALVVAFGAGMAAAVSARELWRPIGVKLAAGAGLGQAVAAMVGPARRRTGGYLVHLGVVAMIVGIAMSSTFRVDQEFQLRRGESASFFGRQLAFLGGEVVREPHRERHVARFEVEGRELSPELRTYPGSMTPIGSPAVRSTLRDDLYLSAMRIEPDGSGVAVHAYLQPLVAWIWIGGGVVVLGALLASIPSRRVP
jgi:cytochrome c-type biogenesis protein CcmF